MKKLLLLLFLAFLYLYLAMPVLALGFTDWSTPLLFIGAILVAISARAIVAKVRTLLLGWQLGRIILRLLLKKPVEVPPNIIDISGYHTPAWTKLAGLTGVIFLAVAIANSIILPILTSHPLLRSQAYRDLLGEVRESSFTSDVEPISTSQIRIIDDETAVRLADKKIGEVPALGSEVQLGELCLQKVRDKLYYVAPLEHRGFFQWLTNQARGSKGYVMVSATNPQDVHLVQSINGREVRIKYQMRGFLFDYLPRYLYFHGLVDVGMTDYSFQVDDDLNPYWVVTLYRNKVGYSGPDAVGVAIVNAETGEITRYSLDAVPAWVNRIQPEEFIYSQITDWGRYVNGFWNSILAKTGTLKPTGDRLHLIYGNHNVYWYTGITSSGRDESTVGFILVNSRTKEAKWYKVAGATENAARKSAEGQVQEKGYRAGYPILYNIYGVPTYIAPLKDKEGLLKLVSFISVENYNLVGVGPDIESALRSYQQKLADKGNAFIPGAEVRQGRLSGRVSRVNQVVKGGESYFYFTLENDPRIFVGTAATSPKLPLLKAGDQVTILYNEGSESPIGIVQFEAAGY